MYHFRSSPLSILFCIALGYFSSEAYAKEFHLPRTEAEKALDKILAPANQDENLFDFVIKRPGYHSIGSYHNLFTPALLNAVAKTEAVYVSKNCNGKYIEGDVCGFDYNPITCSQDPPSIYAYQTRMQSQQKAIILSGTLKSIEPIAIYTLMKKSGFWKIDGIDCGKGDKFNMP